jgi:tRNA-dihydrouridine synthase
MARRPEKRPEVDSSHLILVVGDIDAAASARRVFAKLRADTCRRVREAEGSPWRFDRGTEVETPAVREAAR